MRNNGFQNSGRGQFISPRKIPLKILLNISSNRRKKCVNDFSLGKDKTLYFNLTPSDNKKVTQTNLQPNTIFLLPPGIKGLRHRLLHQFENALEKVEQVAC